MRKETLRLWQQALHDLDTGEKLLGIETYYASVFFAEQAAEMALKALHIEKRRKMEFTHDLTEIAHALDAPGEIARAAAELSPDYVTTRYPNAANAVPAKLYDARSAKQHLVYGRRVVQWVRKELGSKG